MQSRKNRMLLEVLMKEIWSGWAVLEVFKMHNNLRNSLHLAHRDSRAKAVLVEVFAG